MTCDNNCAPVTFVSAILPLFRIFYLVLISHNFNEIVWKKTLLFGENSDTETSDNKLTQDQLFLLFTRVENDFVFIVG